jgi:hypothetical protein
VAERKQRRNHPISRTTMGSSDLGFWSTQAEESQDRAHDDDQTDDIDNAVHGSHLFLQLVFAEHPVLN